MTFLADDIARAALHGELGPHRKTYATTSLSTRRQVLEGVGTLAAALIAVIGIASGAKYVMVFGITGVLMIGGRLIWDLLWLSYIRTRNRHTRLDLFERGLVVIAGDRPRCIRYDTTTLRRNIVEHAKSPAPEQVSHSYTLTDTAGDSIMLRHTIENPDEWGRAIDQAVTNAQLPGATTILDAGGRLDFEFLWLTRTEIGAGKRSVSWSAVTDIEVSGGWVSIRVAGRSRPMESLPVSMIPNFTIFYTLAQRMRKEHARLSK